MGVARYGGGSRASVFQTGLPLGQKSEGVGKTPAIETLSYGRGGVFCEQNFMCERVCIYVTIGAPAVAKGVTEMVM